MIQLCKEKMNPYILCYKRRPSDSALEKLEEIKMDEKSDKVREYLLPDFWHLQLQHGL